MSDPTPERGVVARLAATLTDGNNLRTLAPLGVATVVAVFANLGIEGDLLPRLLRNEPTWVTVSLLLATVGLMLPVLALSPKVDDRYGSIGAFLMLLAVAAGVVVAVRASGEREQPVIAVTRGADPTDGGNADVTVTATGLNLASDERMLLRVVLLPDTATMALAEPACSSTAGDSWVLDTGGHEELEGSVVGAWIENGGDLTGGVETTTTVEVPDGFGLLCAHAVLTPKGSSPRSDDARFSTALVDLDVLGTAG